MRARLDLHALVLVVVIASGLVVPRMSWAQGPKKVAMSVLLVTRSAVWPPPPAAPVLRAKPGVEIVVVSIRSVAEKVGDIYSDATLVDSKGEEHRAAADALANIDNQPLVYKQTWVFSVNKGTTLKALIIGPVTLELSEKHERPKMNDGAH